MLSSYVSIYESAKCFGLSIEQLQAVSLNIE